MNNIFISALFAVLLGAAAAFAWQSIGNFSISPLNLALPFLKYGYEKYVSKKGDFSTLNKITDVFNIEDQIKVISYPVFQGGPKFQTIYVFLGISFIISIVLILIPFKATTILGFMLSISYTVAFALNLYDMNNIDLLQLPIPVYANLVLSSVGLFISTI